MKLANYWLLAFIFCVASAHSQTPYNINKINKKAIALFAKAQDDIGYADYNNAIENLDKAIKIDANFLDAYIAKAFVFNQQKKYQLAVSNFETSLIIDSNYCVFSFFELATSLAGIGQFAQALDKINIFIANTSPQKKVMLEALNKKRNYEFAVDYEVAHSKIDKYIFEPINLGDNINTSRLEYYPSLSFKDSTLVFTRRGAGNREDFFSSKIINGKCSEAKIIDGSINDEPFKGAISISANGDYIIFAGEFKTLGFGNFDLYISYKQDDGWSQPQNLGSNINTENWESSPCLSPDGNILYFSSNRQGGHGGKDLYFSKKQPNGKWGLAQNMGGNINSNGNETSPYIHTDNQTFYFTSDGWQGYGATDLFICRKLINNQFTLPQNLGYPINTIESEGSIAISSNGTTAYYASDKFDSKGGLDIYSFNLRQDIRPFATYFVKGIVCDVQTSLGVASTIELIDNANKQTIMQIETDISGNYFVPLPIAKNYTFAVNKKNYLYHTKTFNLLDNKTDTTYNLDIALQPIALNATMVFNNLRFESNSAQLLPISLIELEKLVQLLNENSTIKLLVKGHTDNVGKPEDNIKLSQLRAKAVVDYLISKQINANRLGYKGMGSLLPIANNATEAGRFSNRRTEFEIVGL
jgi:outer membrane protein OmpA-like peptidoglycan-associated protein